MYPFNPVKSWIPLLWITWIPADFSQVSVAKTQTEYQSEKSTHVIPCLVWWNLIPSNYGLHVFSKHVWTLSTQNLAEILTDLCRFSTRWAENDYSAFFASTSKKVPPSHHHCSHPFIQKQNEEQQKTVLKNTMNYKGFHEDFIVGRHPEFLLRLVSASRVLTFCEGSTFPPYSLGRNLSSKVRMSGCLQRMRQVWMPGLLMSRRVLRCHLEVLENMITYIYIYIFIYAHMVGSLYLFMITVYAYIIILISKLHILNN